MAEEDKDKIIAKLKKELHHAEENLKLSAGLGNGLLQQNNELELKCEELTLEYSQKIEVRAVRRGRKFRLDNQKDQLHQAIMLSVNC